MSELKYQFRYCGFHFSSEIPLQSLQYATDDISCEKVELHLGHVPAFATSDPVGIHVDDTGRALIVAGGIGRFSVANGKQVVADVDPGTEAGAVEAIILGPVLGMLCFQKNILALHTNAILIGDTVVALCGRSGAGKSTMAAILTARGHKLIADDVLPVQAENGQTWAIPGNQHLRLWGETLRYLGTQTQTLRRAAIGEREKYFLPPNGQVLSGKRLLKALVWLETGPARSDKLELYEGVLRARTLAKSTYRREIVPSYVALGRSQLADLSLPGVAVYQFGRQRGLDRLEDQATMIEHLMQGVTDIEH